MQSIPKQTHIILVYENSHLYSPRVTWAVFTISGLVLNYAINEINHIVSLPFVFYSYQLVHITNKVSVLEGTKVIP